MQHCSSVPCVIGSMGKQWSETKFNVQEGVGQAKVEVKEDGEEEELLAEEQLCQGLMTAAQVTRGVFLHEVLSPWGRDLLCTTYKKKEQVCF